MNISSDSLQESFYSVSYEEVLKEDIKKVDLKRISLVELEEIIRSMTKLSLMYYQVEKFSTWKFPSRIGSSDLVYHKAALADFRKHLYDLWDEHRNKLMSVGVPYQNIPFLLRRTPSAS